MPQWVQFLWVAATLQPARLVKQAEQVVLLGQVVLVGSDASRGRACEVLALSLVHSFSHGFLVGPGKPAHQSCPL